VTPDQQVRLAGAIQAVYDGAPAPAGYDLIDRTFIRGDVRATSYILRDQPTGKFAQAVRGTETFLDGLLDLDFAFDPSPFGVGRTERGFTSYYSQAKTESGHPLPPIDWLGGHSLGGPAATLFGAVAGSPAPELLLIATPEPGDQDFAHWATPRFAAIHRWENPNDVVPDAPGRFLGYCDLLVPPTVIDMTAIGIDPLDKLGNHRLANYIAAYLRENT